MRRPWARSGAEGLGIQHCPRVPAERAGSAGPHQGQGQGLLEQRVLSAGVAAPPDLAWTWECANAWSRRPVPSARRRGAGCPRGGTLAEKPRGQGQERQTDGDKRQRHSRPRTRQDTSRGTAGTRAQKSKQQTGQAEVTGRTAGNQRPLSSLGEESQRPLWVQAGGGGARVTEPHGSPQASVVTTCLWGSQRALWRISQWGLESQRPFGCSQTLGVSWHHKEAHNCWRGYSVF